jgi:hypothetical protein
MNSKFLYKILEFSPYYKFSELLGQAHHDGDTSEVSLASIWLYS